MKLENKYMKILAVIVITLLVLVVILVWDDDGYVDSEYDPNYIVFSRLDDSILDTSDEVYEELRETLSPSDARVQLVDMLNDLEGVSEAALGVDGYTVFINFSDGDFAAFDTFEHVEGPDAKGGTGFMVHEGLSPAESSKEDRIHFGYSSGEDRIPSSSYSTVSFDVHDVGSSGKLTCASKQVLILCPTYWELEYPSDLNLRQHIDSTVQLLKDYGWDDDEITMKYAYDCPWEENSDCLLLTPDDFFNLGEYGIVIFVGHGFVRGYRSFEETNLYLQFCYMANESFQMNRQFREWKKDTKLIITNKYDQNPGGTVYSTAIRADVLREKLTGTLDSSIYLFPVCYGGFLNQVYLDAGVGVFVGWNNEVDSLIADECNKDILRQMLEDRRCAYDAYADGSILKGYNYKPPSEMSYEVPIWTGGDPGYKRTEFFIFPDPVGDDTSFNFFLPAWMDLIVTGIPDGTTSIIARVYDSESTLISQSEQKASGATQIEMEEVGGLFIPADITLSISVHAYNNGEEVATGETTVTVNPGESVSSVSLSELGAKPRWVICGSDDTSDLASTKLIDGGNVCITPYLNGEKIRIYPNEPQTFSCLNYWAIAFPASSGDSLTIKITSSKEPAGVSHHCGELWLYCEADVSKQMKLYDAKDFGVYEGTETERVLLWEKTYTLP